MIRDCTDQLLELFNQLSPAKTARELIEPSRDLPDDETIIAMVKSSPQAAKFNHLFGGDYSDYTSQSEADMALCTILAFWWGGDAAAIDRMFRRSRLMRPKWDESHDSGGNHYGQITIRLVLDQQTEFYPHDETGGVAVVVNMADVQPQAVDWLWPNRIALGKLTIISGDPGLGKSIMSIDLAARVTTGKAWPDDPNACPPRGSVLLLSAEDDLADTIRPRLDAAGADVARVTAIKAIRSSSNSDRLLDLSCDISVIQTTLHQLPDCKLVVIDPISAYLGKTKSHNDAEVRRVLAPLAEMAARSRVAVVAISHLRKEEGSALYRPMGSIGFIATARAAFVVVKDKGDSTGTRRFWLPVKNNLGNDQTGMAFRVAKLSSQDLQPRIVWEPGSVSVTADEALAPRKGGRKPKSRDQAEEFLKQALANGPIRSNELEEIARSDGITKRTLIRAKNGLGVNAFREPLNGPWFWRLPSEAATNGDSAEANNDCTDGCAFQLDDVTEGSTSETE